MGKSLSMSFVILSVLLVASGVESVNQVLNGTLGKSFYFYESIPADDNIYLQWFFKGTLMAQRFPGGTPQCIGQQFAGRCSLFINGTLRLDNVTPGDDGTYSFLAQFNNNTVIRNPVYDFKVYSPLSAPVLSSNSTNNNRFVNGTYVSLHCDGGGQSITRYTFYQDGKNICSEPRVNCTNAYLYFQPITVSDRGNYTCDIQNPASFNTSNTLHLTVSVPVSDVRLTRNASGILWPGINATSLTCSALGTEASYTWSLKGAALPQDPRYQLTQDNSVLIISPVSYNDDGPFVCNASNWINSVTSNNLTFILAASVSHVNLTSNPSSASTIVAGENSVSLHCSANGTEVHFAWKPLILNDPHYNITVSDSPPSSTLTISPISKNDTGPFICEASNLISNLTSNNTISFNVFWRPTEKNINCAAQKVNEGIELQCLWPGGNPAANVTLTFNNITKTGNDSVNQTVTLGSDQASNFTCHGEQLERTSECARLLSAPQAIGHDNNSVTQGSAGSQIVLKVTLLQDGLPCNFSWSTPTNSTNQNRATARAYTIHSTDFSSSLTIPDATASDSGTYKCTAVNSIGIQTVLLFTVNVTARVEIPTKPPSTTGGLGGGAIAGIVIGVLAGIALIGILVFFLVRKN